MNQEIKDLINGIDLKKPMANAELNQLRNIILAFDNLLRQMDGHNTLIQTQLEAMREFYSEALKAGTHWFSFKQ